MFKTAKAKKRRFSAVLNVLKRFSNTSKTLPSKIEHKNEIARKTEDILIFRAIFLTLQFSFTFPILSHSTQNITHFRHFLPFPIQFHPFPPFSTFLRFPCQLTVGTVSGKHFDSIWRCQFGYGPLSFLQKKSRGNFVFQFFSFFNIICRS